MHFENIVISQVLLIEQPFSFQKEKNLQNLKGGQSMMVQSPTALSTVTNYLTLNILVALLPSLMTPTSINIFGDNKDKSFRLDDPGHAVSYMSKEYKTAEHLFQALKFLEYRPGIAKLVRESEVPFKEGRSHGDNMRPDWFAINITMMQVAFHHKFDQHRNLKARLLLTGNATLIADFPDPFWGKGTEGKGQNKQGSVLMNLRSWYKQGLSPPVPPPVPTQTIEFYDKAADYYYFTNFSDHSVVYNGGTYPTSEHLFQSFKFGHRQSVVKKILGSDAPMHAFRTGKDRDNSKHIRRDWEKVRVMTMRYIIFLKFTQHKGGHGEDNLRQNLLDTGNAKLIEASDIDDFWGWGKKKDGQNQLGKALMRVRNIIRHGLPPPPPPPPPRMSWWS